MQGLVTKYAESLEASHAIDRHDAVRLVKLEDGAVETIRHRKCAEFVPKGADVDGVRGVQDLALGDLEVYLFGVRTVVNGPALILSNFSKIGNCHGGFLSKSS